MLLGYGSIADVNAQGEGIGTCFPHERLSSAFGAVLRTRVENETIFPTASFVGY